ncbi:hypothetical protein DC522_01095 [Microvirga sp. KLBC 81]|nr:hypothetical protein DC522_01095 [Microvirga sp. KLBC 81]
MRRWTGGFYPAISAKNNVSFNPPTVRDNIGAVESAINSHTTSPFDQARIVDGQVLIRKRGFDPNITYDLAGIRDDIFVSLQANPIHSPADKACIDQGIGPAGFVFSIEIHAVRCTRNRTSSSNIDEALDADRRTPFAVDTTINQQGVIPIARDC